MIFAQMPDPGSFQSIGWVIVSVAALATAWNQITRAVDRAKDKPAPADVRAEAHERFATKAELQATEAKIGQLRSDTDKSIVDLYDKVNRAISSTESLATLTEMQGNLISESRSDIKELISGKEDRHA